MGSPNYVSDWADMTEKDHFVQFYDDDRTMAEAVAAYFAFGIRFGESCGLIAIAEHTRSIISAMGDLNCDVDAAVAEGRFIAVDAAQLLSEFMVEGRLNEPLFRSAVGSRIATLSEKRRPVRLFGEMVGLLAKEGKFQEALELERLWNRLAETSNFRLFCAYPQTMLAQPELGAVVSDICSAHSHAFASRMPQMSAA